MKVEYINPFLDAAMNVIKTMTAIDVQAGKPALKTNNLTFGDVSGVIGLAGTNVSGNLVVSFEKNCILKIVNTMLCADYTELTDDIVDAVGEITNMICGNTKRDLSALGISIQMATPMIIRGQNIEISQLSKAPVITIPFKTPNGMFTVDANLYTDQKGAEKPAADASGKVPH
ncbi:MAG: chemotaxis protein CheX [Bdellovibrionota bacterium]